MSRHVHELLPDTEMVGAQSSVLPTSVQTPPSVSVHADLPVHSPPADVSKYTPLEMLILPHLPTLLQPGLPDVQVLPKLGIQSSFMTTQEGVQTSYAHIRPSMSSPSMAYGPCFPAETLAMSSARYKAASERFAIDDTVLTDLQVREMQTQQCNLINFPVSVLKQELKNFGSDDVGIKREEFNQEGAANTT